MAQQVGAGPLRGIRVLDFSSIVAGPIATFTLASLGAEVIKVERMDGGDDSRHMGPHCGPWSSAFVPLNRGKKSIAVDITKPAGRDVILKLSRDCDVFIENFRVGKMEKLGLGESAVRRESPEIIYLSLSAFGSSGPDSLKPGYEALVQGRSGIMSVTGSGPESAPVRAGVPVIDASTGLWAVIGVLAALVERKNSGQGQSVKTSLLGSGVMLMGHNLVGQQFSGSNPVPQGSRYPSFGESGGSFSPYGAFATADGWLMIGVSNDRIFRRLCLALDRPNWFDDPRFSTNILRVNHRAEFGALLQEVLCQKPTAHWDRVFDTHDVPVAPIQKASQVLNDPQVNAMGQFDTIQLPGSETQHVKMPRIPLELSKTPLGDLSSAPALGQHGREILNQIGYSQVEIDGLIANKICKLP